MIELMRTTDPVWLSFVEALLRDAGIESIRLDQHMSVMEGSLSILPQRLMVADEDEAPAKRLLAEARAEFEQAGEAGAQGGDGA